MGREINVVPPTLERMLKNENAVVQPWNFVLSSKGGSAPVTPPLVFTGMLWLISTCRSLAPYQSSAVAVVKLKANAVP